MIDKVTGHKVVRFKQGWRVWNGGDKAGFPAAEADKLIEVGIAVDYQPDAEDAEKAKAAAASAPAGGESTLSDLNAKEAIALVEKTGDEATLMKWVDTETRKTVLDAIEGQLKQLAEDAEKAKAAAASAPAGG